MHRRQALKLFTGLALCPLCAGTSFGKETHAGPHWDYEGATGPSNWSKLDAANRVCSTGTQQSPIDLSEPVIAQQSDLSLGWKTRPDTIVNNGHTIQLNFSEGSILSLGKRTYGLTQFHFHQPSEHRVNGKSFAMEAHFVHAAAGGGGLAVVGVFMVPGKTNEVFNKIVSTMPAKESSPVPADRAIDPNGLMPARQDYYRYEGSLTTPPCSETVDWLVLTDHIEVADVDIAGFAKLYPMNARPVQNSNRRFILTSN